MVTLFGHRQRKGPATVKPHLSPPRHIPALPNFAVRRVAIERPLSLLIARKLPVHFRPNQATRRMAGIRISSQKRTDRSPPPLLSFTASAQRMRQSHPSEPNSSQKTIVWRHSSFRQTRCRVAIASAAHRSGMKSARMTTDGTATMCDRGKGRGGRTRPAVEDGAEGKNGCAANRRVRCRACLASAVHLVKLGA
jgi:hypothetical protein